MGKSIIVYNHCDKYLSLLIASLAFGGVGGAYQIVRILSILLLPFVINRFPMVKGYLRPFLAALSLFYIYCLLSLIWTPDKAEAVKELIYYPIHFLLFVEILIFARFAKEPLRSISYGWVMAVFLTSFVAIWEFTTDHHLNISRYGYDGVRMANLGTEIMQRHFAAATFTNLNSYVTFLCFAFPFLSYGFMQAKKKSFESIFFILNIFLSIIFILFNASRGGLLTICLMGLTYLLSSKKNQRTIMLLTIILIGGAFVLLFLNDMLTLIHVRVNSSHQLTGEDRFTIWQHAWEAFMPTCGLGVGVGGMIKAMETVTRGITSTHNIGIEILLQYGVLFFSAFIYYLFYLFKSSIKIKEKSIRTALFMALFAMPFYLIIDSGYLLKPVVFAAFASIQVFTNFERSLFLHRFFIRYIKS